MVGLDADKEGEEGTDQVRTPSSFGLFSSPLFMWTYGISPIRGRVSRIAYWPAL